MSGKSDKVKGRVKEATGVMTDSKSLKRKGKVDQAAGAVKETAENIVDAAKDALTRRKKR